ncbi:Archaemetzincin-2 [Gossypium arboreum]|uniref:Archaemetzincin-2 n=1 Tax=Gossypium arboreum TaxID=29729 RepID=A0A0B0NRY6_GOSAR|nr:Archaemetzincin-2 [Gossypium arboreum]
MHPLISHHTFPLILSKFITRSFLVKFTSIILNQSIKNITHELTHIIGNKINIKLFLCLGFVVPKPRFD